MKTVTLVLTLALTLLGPWSATPSPGRPSGRSGGERCEDGHGRGHRFGPEARVEFVGIDGRGNERGGAGFRGDRLSDLRIVVDWRHLDHTHVQRLALIAPDGSLYQTFTTGVSSPSPTSGRARVETTVPVEGTWITNFGLFGSWCVHVFLDEEPEPVARRSFHLSRPR